MPTTRPQPAVSNAAPAPQRLETRSTDTRRRAIRKAPPVAGSLGARAGRGSSRSGVQPTAASEVAVQHRRRQPAAAPRPQRRRRGTPDGQLALDFARELEMDQQPSEDDFLAAILDAHLDANPGRASRSGKRTDSGRATSVGTRLALQVLHEGARVVFVVALIVAAALV